MSYSTIARVEELLPEVWIDHTTHPTRAMVEGWLPDIAGALDVALASGGSTLPISDTGLLGKLDMLEGKEAAFMVMQAKGTATDDENPALWELYHEEFLAALELFATPGATVAGSGVVTPYAKTDVCPVFKRCDARNF